MPARVDIQTQAQPPTMDERKALPTRRLSLSFSASVYEELSSLARRRRSSMTEIIRLALGLVKIAIREADAGNKLVVTTPDGQPIKEIVLPE